MIAVAWKTAANCVYVAVFYVFTRFVVSKGHLLEAIQVSPDTCRTFLPFAIVAVVIGVALELVQEAGWPLTALFINLTALTLGALWAVSAPGGGEVISPTVSIRRGLVKLPWAMTLWIVAGLPIGFIYAILGLIGPEASNTGWLHWALFGTDLLIACAGGILTFATIHAIARHLGLITAERSV